LPFRNLKSIHDAAKLLDHPEAKYLMRDFPLYDQMPPTDGAF
jgi:hypothetical protein